RREAAHRAAQVDDDVEARLGLEVRVRLAQLRDAELLGEQRADARTEALGRVDARADRRATERQLADREARLPDPLRSAFDLLREAAELLAVADRHRVHQVRTAGLDDVER